VLRNSLLVSRKRAKARAAEAEKRKKQGAAAAQSAKLGKAMVVGGRKAVAPRKLVERVHIGESVTIEVTRITSDPKNE